jgi:hypothetical protein
MEYIEFLNKIGWLGTEEEWYEIVTLEYVLTWGYENAGDAERHKELHMKGWFGKNE